MNKEELRNINGGASSTINGTLLSGISKLVQTIYDVGRGIGSAISRMKNNNYC